MFESNIIPDKNTDSRNSILFRGDLLALGAPCSSFQFYEKLMQERNEIQ